MKVVREFAFVCAVLIPAIATAQQPAASRPDQPEQQKPAEKPAEPPKYEETVVVSASRTEEKLVNAPATVSVIGPQVIQSAPTQNFADLLRAVPGINVTQVSARDINITSRGATGTLATGQLALVDGRSLYQDFFGFVMWDFLPVNFDEIRQIEVIRGPASAVWGANALNGVVNVITKSPRDMQGSSFTLGFGGFDRDVGGSGQGAGSLWYINGTHAGAANERWSYKVSAGGYGSDPLPRPTGVIPGSITSQSYPSFTNTGTTQPKFDSRVDYDFADGARKLTFAGGVVGTEGIMHTGIGPFDINSGSVMGYFRTGYTKGPMRVQFFTNVLNGEASNLLAIDPTGTPIHFDFGTNTYDFEFANAHTLAARHLVSYGGNFRYNAFDLSLAPEGDNRKEGGAYVQDEMFLHRLLRLVVGGRVDGFSNLDDAVFSPRVALLLKPTAEHTVRVSYNRAYRAPSVINEYLRVTLTEPINLGAFSPLLAGRVYPLPIFANGNQDLSETKLDAFEVGYTGTIAGRATVSAAWYQNKTKDDILFTELTARRWTAANPPPGWPLPAAVINLVPGRSFPAQFTYQNFGTTTQRGVELGIDTLLARNFSAFLNYSWQDDPEPEGFAISELNLPPTNRVNAGINFNLRRFLGNVSVTYQDDAYWQDVLDDRFHGVTESHTLVNAGVGVKFAGDKLTTSVKVVNLANEAIQQHVFGDVLKRQVVGELKVRF